MNDKRTKLLSEAPLTKAILTMSLPVVMGMMVQVLYNLVDTFFIGRLGDPNQLAAANITTPLFMILMAIAGIIGTGAASFISRCLGEKNHDIAHKTLSTGIILCGALALLVTFFGCLFTGPIVKALGASEGTYSYAYNYSIILLGGAFFIMCNYAIGQLMRSEGAAMASMMGMLIGTVANIILDPIFIFGFDMGIQGAAIATVLGNICALMYYVWHYAKDKSLVKFSPKYFSFDKTIWREIFIIGTPASLSQMLMSFSMIICNNLAASYGDTVVAGMGVASKIMTIGTFIFMGFAAGCQPLVGFNYGAKNFDRVKGVIKQGMTLTTVIGLVLTVIFAYFAPTLIGFFTPLTDVVEQGTIILRALMLSLPVMGAQMLSTTTAQAMGKPLASLFLSISRQGLLYIPLLFILNSTLQFNGLIYAQPIVDVCIVVVSIITLFVIIKKDHSLHAEAQIAPKEADVKEHSPNV